MEVAIKMKNDFFRWLTFLAGLVLVVLPSIFGCGKATDGELRDVIPEFACSIAGSDNSVLVVSGGVMREFTRGNNPERKYDERSSIKPTWPGRVLSVASIKGTDSFVAIVFDIGSENRSKGRTDYADCYSLYSFQIKNGKLTNLQIVQTRVIQGQPVGDSKYFWETNSVKGPSEDCYRYSRFISSKIQFEEGRLLHFSASRESESYCAQSNFLVFCTSSNLPFLINQYGHVIGRFIRDRDFEFGAEALEDPERTALHKESVALDGYHNSVDCTNDETFLAITTDFYSDTRIAIWNRLDGKLLFVERLPKTRNEAGLSDRVSCLAIGSRAFCFVVGTQLNVVRLDSQVRQVISAKQDTEKYTGVSVLGFQSIDDRVKATCVLTPVDSGCVREIEFNL